MRPLRHALALATALLAAAGASAGNFSVSGTATLELLEGGSPAFAVSYPLSGVSQLSGAVHQLGPLSLGGPTEAHGSVSAAHYRLPFFDTLELGGASLAAGQVAIPGVATGLGLELESLVLSGRESVIFGRTPRSFEDGESLAFASAVLGAGAAAPPGEMRDGDIPLSSASVGNGGWAALGSQLGSDGGGSILLEAPFTLSSALQPSAGVAGRVRLDLQFVPEPGAPAMLAAGSLTLGALTARRRRTL